MRLIKEDVLLYAVTDRAWTVGEKESARTRSLIDQVEAAIRGGATLVQLREKDLPEAEFEDAARALLHLCRSYGVPLLINDNVALAKRVGADGVHVGQSDMDPHAVRQILGENAIVGVTAKTLEQALAAEAAVADYLGSGAVFGTSTKPDAIPLDLDLFEAICRGVSIPVVAIGGITKDNIMRLKGRGMSGFAVVSGIFAADDIEGTARILRERAERLCETAGAMAPVVRRYSQKVRTLHPVVQCITNYITAGDCANALLAIGASPTMAHHPKEMEDFVRATDALVLNMGATESVEAMQRAAHFAYAKNASAPIHPVIIDPVGCASSRFRREICRGLIEASRPVCIRGNAAEIKALATDQNTGRGVDEPDDLPEGAKYALLLAKKTGAIVIASGEVDYIASQDSVTEIRGGSALFKRMTGSGCILSALLGAFLAAEPSAESAAACCLLMAKCGETAGKRTAAESKTEHRRGAGMGSFHMHLLDALSEAAYLP